jgi:RNA polymerase sigma factor (sigma-70 family)
MAPDAPPLHLLRGDEAELFRSHEVALRAAVRHHVNTSDAVIEDACSFAWLQLMRRQPNRDTVFAWLRTVATREAWRLHAQAVRELPSDLVYADQHAPPEHLLTTTDARRLIDAIGVLSPKQRLVLLLFISGHSYKEIAADHDLSATAVNKALVRARRHLRAVHDVS